MTGFRFLRIRGIPVEAHSSWPLLFAAIVLAVMGRLGRPEIDSVTLIAMALACALLHFASILAHELGHALWALRERWHVDRITLHGLGGIAWTRSGPYASPRAQLRVIAAGPLVTAALVVLFGASERIGEALAWPRPVVDVAGFLAFLQVGVLLFNLTPAFPLDGGQLLRAWLWRRWGDAVAATRTAVRTGLLSAYLALVAAVILLVSGTLYVGWIVAVAGMQILAIVAAFSRAAPPARRSGLELVGDLVRERPLAISEASSLGDFLDRVTGARGLATRAFAVTREGKLVGYLSIGLARQVAEDGRSATVAEAMVQQEGAIQLDPNTPLEEALEQVPDVTDRAIVVEDGRVTGIVLRSTIAEALLEAAAARRQRPELAGVPW